MNFIKIYMLLYVKLAWEWPGSKASASAVHAPNQTPKRQADAAALSRRELIPAKIILLQLIG
jgi:hypothetical protein